MSQADPLGELLSSLLERQGLSERMHGYQVWRYWSDAVGPQIAQQAQPLRIRDGVLEVRVGHPVWMQQLQLLKPRLLKQLNQHLGDDALQDIYFRRGTVVHPKDRDTSLPDKPWQSVRLDSEDQEAIDELLQRVDDPDLQRSLRDLLQRQRQLDKYRNND